MMTILIINDNVGGDYTAVHGDYVTVEFHTETVNEVCIGGANCMLHI